MCRSRKPTVCLWVTAAMLFVSPYVRGQTTLQSTPSVDAATTLPASTTPSPLLKFRVYPRSAISMQGKNYYVNFETMTGTSDRVADVCIRDPTCVCFDFDAPSGQVGTGWLHRVPPGGDFLNGTAGGSTLFERLPQYRLDNITSSCVLQKPTSGDPSLATIHVVASVFVTLAATLAGSAAFIFVVLMLMRFNIIRVPGAPPPPDPDLLPLNENQ